MRADEILADKVNETEVNGVVIRKGSVGAFLANAKIFADPNTRRKRARLLSATS